MAASALYSPFKLPACIAAMIALLDQATKILVINHLDRSQYIVIIPDFFHLVHHRNPGAAWGMFSDYTFFLAVLSLIVLGILVLKFKALVDAKPEQAIALATVAGGIFGNLIDRLFRSEVIDFLHLFRGRFHWPVFNIADSAITCGVIVYIVSNLLRHEQPASNPQ